MTFECSLSARGWRIDTSWPLRVKEAVVRWGGGKQFGLEFAEIHLSATGTHESLDQDDTALAGLWAVSRFARTLG